MSEDRFTAADEDAADNQSNYRNDVLWMTPKVIFGLRAAALAGMFVSAGAAAIGLAGPLDDAVAGDTWTTCCGDG